MPARIQREESAMMYCSPFAPKLPDGITAHDDPLTRERITRSGVVESLQNPFEAQELPDAIHRVA
jgi:hypothetical protein